MRNVDIFFNPYTEKTRLIIDNKERKNTFSRLEEFIIGQPPQKWLSPYVFSYQKWCGFLPELMDNLNDDEIKLCFFTLPQYFRTFAAALDKQSALIEEKGYSADLWRCTYQAAFVPADVHAKFLKFVYSRKSLAPDQYSLSLFDYAEENLNNINSQSVERLKEIYKNLQNAVQTSKDFVSRRRHNESNIHIWENAEKELQRIFDF